MGKEQDTVNEHYANKEEGLDPLVTFKFNDKFFEANGKKFVISEAISVDRFKNYQIFELELSYGRTFMGFFNELQDLMKLLNGMKFAEAAVKTDALLKGILEIDKREHAVLKFCSLFINYEDEDTGFFDEDVMKQKIEDWREGRVDMNSFFFVAGHLIQGFTDAYKKLSLSISEMEAAAITEEALQTEEQTESETPEKSSE